MDLGSFWEKYVVPAYYIFMEILFYFSRGLNFVIIAISVMAATIVILKFSCGIKFSTIPAQIFKDKHLSKNLSSAFLGGNMNEKTPEQRLSQAKIKLIQRTMLFLCIADILLCVDQALYYLMELPFVKLDFFTKHKKELYYEIYRHINRTVGHFRMFCYFLTASWSVCYLIALFQSLNKMVWTNKGCSIYIYDICFHVCSFVGSLIFFLLWAGFRNGWLVLTTMTFYDVPASGIPKIWTIIEDYITGILYILSFLGNLVVFLLNLATVLAIFFIVERNIIKGAKSLGLKSQNVIKQEGKFFFFFAKFLIPNLIFFFVYGVYFIFMALANFVFPFFNVFQTPFWLFFDYSYLQFFPAHAILMFFALLVNINHVRIFCCCCCCCECLPDQILRTFCCGRRNKKAKQRELVLSLREYSKNQFGTENMNEDSNDHAAAGMLGKMDQFLELEDNNDNQDDNPQNPEEKSKILTKKNSKKEIYENFEVKATETDQNFSTLEELENELNDHEMEQEQELLKNASVNVNHVQNADVDEEIDNNLNDDAF